ncbi:response regulator [Alteromonas sp. ASW11-36]|uniref:Response regulator n=1 Tax=Alteromonas arenosi TaxID=3055817 RepID=A0ABT7SY19_9ALTE|nr:response regulator [Alteromonas sp. ASW11-36]MDM7861060.1 response regulator [Alteromonas sp. ASW11-36]
MKKIPAPLEPREISVLIIDGQSLIQDSVKNALNEVGITKVKNAQNAFYALRLCENTQFNIILIAFDVSADKDGFHLYEELKMKGHIKKDTTVVFLSAETSPELVNCIIELQPDDFWVKPLDRAKVERRLSYLLNVRLKLHKLLYCLDHHDYSAAIYHAERQLLDPSLKDLVPRIKRIIGDCYINLHEFAEAERYYTKLLEDYSYGWVSIGLTRALLKQGKKDEADVLIEEMLERDDTRFNTYDLLAQYHIEHEQYAEAYEQMKEASRLAPRNINRNKKLWDLARLNHDKMGQYQATQNMARYAKNSIHDSPELTLNVIRSGIDLATNLTIEEATPFLQKAERDIAALKQTRGSMAVGDEQLAVLQARLLCVRNDKSGAEKIMDEQVSMRDNASLEDNLDKMKAFHELGQKEKSLAILDRLGKQIAGDTFSSNVVNEYLKQESIERREISFTAKELKEMAAVNYKENRMGPAFQNLKHALKLSPQNKQVAMSLLKVLTNIAKTDRLNPEQVGEAQKAKVLLCTAQMGPAQVAKRDAYLKLLGLDEDEE